MPQPPPAARRFPRRTLLRVLCWLVVYAALTVFLGVILPCEPRVRFEAPEGKEVVTLSSDFRFAITGRDFAPKNLLYKDCCLRNLETGEICEDLSQSAEWLTDIEFSPSNRFLIGTNLTGVRLLELATGRQWSWRKVTGPLSGTFWLSPDEKTVAIVSRGAPATVRIVDLDTERVLVSLVCENGIHFAHGQFSPDSKHFALVDTSGKLRLCDLETGRSHAVGSFDLPRDWLWFSSDSRTLAFYSDKNEVTLWDVPTGTIRFKIPTYRPLAKFSEDGTVMATRRDDGATLIWEVATGEKTNLLPASGTFFFLDPSGTRVVALDGHFPTNVSKEQRYKTTAPARQLVSHGTDGVGASPDGTILATVSVDAIVFADTRTGQELCRIPRDGWPMLLFYRIYDGLSDSAFSPDNRTFAIYRNKPLPHDPFAFYKQLFPKQKARSSSSVDCVELWDMPTGRRLALLPDGKLRGFSTDGKSLAVMNTAENTLEIWDVPPRKPLKKILVGSLLLFLYFLGIHWFCARRRGEDSRAPGGHTQPPGRYVVLYDGACRFCTAQSKNLLALARPGIMEAVDFQQPDALARFPGVTVEACQRAMHLVTPAGRVYKGFEAAVQTVATRPWIGRPAYLYYVPGIRLACDLLYALVARYRYRIMGKSPCSDGACSIHFRREE